MAPALPPPKSLLLPKPLLLLKPLPMLLLMLLPYPQPWPIILSFSVLYSLFFIQSPVLRQPHLGTPCDTLG